MDREALLKRLERAQNSRHNVDRDITTASAGMSDEDLRKHVEKHEEPDDEQNVPHPAGPHARPTLTNPDATPGAGALPNSKAKDLDGGVG